MKSFIDRNLHDIRLVRSETLPLAQALNNLSSTSTSIVLLKLDTTAIFLRHLKIFEKNMTTVKCSIINHSYYPIYMQFRMAQPCIPQIGLGVSHLETLELKAAFLHWRFRTSKQFGKHETS